LSAPQKAVPLMKGMIKMFKTTEAKTQEKKQYVHLWAKIEPLRILRKNEGILPKWRTKE
jgi:hypothetical protein